MLSRKNNHDCVDGTACSTFELFKNIFNALVQRCENLGASGSLSPLTFISFLRLNFTSIIAKNLDKKFVDK